MLRITTTIDEQFTCVLKLEGKLMADWISELQEACRQARAKSGRLQLDLSGLSFVDAPGIITLRELVRQGVAIVTPSPFVSELLNET